MRRDKTDTDQDTGMKKMPLVVGGFVSVRKKVPCWELRSKKPTSALLAPFARVWPAVHKSSA